MVRAEAIPIYDVASAGRAALAWLTGAAGVVLVVAFVGTAAAMGVLASTGGGWPDTLGGYLVLVGAGLANVTLAIGPLLTLGRRRWLAALVMTPILLACGWLSFQSITKFAAEYLLDSAVERAQAAEDYEAASDRIRTLRQQRAEITEVRGQNALKQQIAAILARPVRGGTVGHVTGDCERSTWKAPESCAEVHDLRTALAEAKRRDDLDQEIQDAIAERARLQPVADAQAAGRIIGISRPDAPEPGGLLGWMRRWTGLDIRSAEELRAVSLAFLVWLGELLMPVAVALAGRERMGRRWRIRGPRRSPAAADLMLADASRSVVELWAEARVQAVPGATTGARELYEDFEAWCQSEGRTPVSVFQFGLALSRELKWPKHKYGKAGRIRYQGVRLRAPVPLVVQGGALKVVGGGRR